MKARGGLLTYMIQKQGVNVAAATCLVGLAGTGIAHLISEEHLVEVIFACPFEGMTSMTIRSCYMVGLGGILTGMVFRYAIHLFEVFGGWIGTMVFISSVASYYLYLRDAPAS